MFYLFIYFKQNHKPQSMNMDAGETETLKKPKFFLSSITF